MPIERDLKTLKAGQKVSRTKISQGITALSRRQTTHEKANNKQFLSISSAIAQLPTQDVITKTIQDTVKVVVNGKIDAISAKVDDVGEHLKAQDEKADNQATAIKDLSDKIAPVDMVKTFFMVLWKAIIGAGAFSAAIWAIIKLFHVKL